MWEELLLLRLWAAPDAGQGETQSRISADLHSLTDESAGNATAWRDLFAAVVERLKEAGDLTTGGRNATRLFLSDSGRTRVRNTFKIQGEMVEGKRDKGRAKGWTWWRDRYALPLALGAAGGTADELRRALLRRFYLPGYPAGQTPDSLPKMVDLLLAKRLKVSRVNPSAFRQALLREWISPAPAEEETRRQPVPSDNQEAVAIGGRLPEALADLAGEALLAARRSPTGRFGDKVFVVHVWRTLLAAGQAAPGEADAFKARLVQANTAGLLRLSRADLTGAHDARDVRESEIHYLGEIFHFVRVD